MPENRSEEIARFADQVGYVDELALVVLKGHLVLEETLVRIVEKFVHHPHHLPSRISFHQRVAIARSMSLRNSDSSMWNLILALNTLRNKLAHSLEPEARAQAYKKLESLYDEEMKGSGVEKPAEQHGLAFVASAHCLGFLRAFESEVDRFREVVERMDAVMNAPNSGSKGTG